MMRILSSKIAFGMMIIALGGCDRGPDVEHPTGDGAWEMAHAVSAEEDEIVARVNGQVITTEDVRVEWRSHRDLSADEVLRRVVEREVVAQQAKAVSYHQKEEIPFVRKQGMINALLEEEVESAEIDQSQREPLMEHIRRTRRAPAGLRASHLVMLVPQEITDEEGKTTRLRRDDREHYFEEAQEFIEIARQKLGDSVDDDALREVARHLNEEILEGPFEAAVNEHLRFPRAGKAYEADHLPRGWVSVIDEFSLAADSMVVNDRLGQLSEPARTNFGWHLIRVDEVIAERPVDEEAAQQFVEAELLRLARQQRYTQFVETIIDGVEAEIYPERLGSVFDE